MDRNGIIARLSKSKNTLRTHFGIQAIDLYGSYAKNIASTESNVDLVYLLQPGIHIGLEKRIQLETYLAQLLYTDKIDLVNDRTEAEVFESDNKECDRERYYLRVATRIVQCQNSFFIIHVIANRTQ